MPVPNTFATATAPIPLSQLDTNFATPITLGNTAIQLGNTVTTLNNMTLANVTISSGNVTITNVSVTTANVTTANITTAIIGTANVTTANVTTGIIGTANVTTGNITTAVITTANVATANITTSQILNYGTANSVVYLNSSKAATANTGLQFDGTNLGLGVTPSAWQTSTVAFEVGSGTALWNPNSSNQTYLLTNASYSSSSFKYKSTATAAAYRMVGNSHEWLIAPSGTAGNAVTFTQAMTLDASGNLLVGSTSGSVRLDVVQSNPTRGILQRVYNSSPTSQTGAQLQFTQDSTADWVIGQPAGTNAFAFWTGRNPSNDGTERARITSGGDLLVGTTNSTLGAADGVVIGPIESAWTVSNSGNVPIRIYNKGSAGTRYLMEFRNASSAVGAITHNGTNTTYATSSDYRLKDNIAPMTGALAKVAALKPVTYKWKSTGETDQGFIAHELAEVCPGAVIGEKDAVDAEGKPVYQGIDTSFLVATLTAAIQELNAKVEAQAAEIAALKGNA